MASLMRLTRLTCLTRLTRLTRLVTGLTRLVTRLTRFSVLDSPETSDHTFCEVRVLGVGWTGAIGDSAPASTCWWRL